MDSQFRAPVNPFYAGYTFRCISRQTVCLSDQAPDVGPYLRVKLFETRTIFLQNRYIFNVLNSFCSRRKFSKWMKYYPAYNGLRNGLSTK